jgi:stage III sporulation protein AE
MSHLILSSLTAPTVTGAGAALMPENTDSFGDALMELVGKALGTLRPDLLEGARICFGILAVVLLISVLKLLPGAREHTADFVGAVGISALLLGSSHSLVHLSVDTVRQMSHYGKLLLPVMTSALAAQGGITSSAALYAGTALFDTILCTLLTELLVPAVYIYLTLSAACAATGEEILKRLSGLVKWLSVWVLKIVLYIFTGYMGITGVVSGTTDAAALKAAKITISGAVPVVGGILSDASEAVLVGAGIVKNTAGIYGVLAILAIFAGPFLRVGCHYLLIKTTGAVCSVFGAKRCTDLITEFSVAMGLLLAMLGSVCLLQLISTVCFLRGVG